MCQTPAEFLTSGAQVWVPDTDKVWVKATVLRSEGGGILVKKPDGSEQRVDSKTCYLQNLDSKDVEDMTRLAFLHEPGVLWNLSQRYTDSNIYTNTGSILIAINPFAPQPQLYGPSIIQQYMNHPTNELAPHVYAVACQAYRQMLREGSGQAILITGESGAGKTETSKLIMTCLAHLGAHHGQQSSLTGLEQKVLESNPLLEAFGNAKTVRNDNSSRFGKYVELRFSPHGELQGAAVRTYLLERSRVVSINSPERSFHVFYQLCHGASPQERARWHLGSPSQFRNLSQSSCVQLPGVSDAEQYQHTRHSMTAVGLSTEQQDAAFAIVAAVLHLCNVTFREPAGLHDASEVEPGSSLQHLQHAAELLGVACDALQQVLVTRTIQTVDGPLTSPLSPQAASEARDALAKVLYARLFDWLVARINMALGADTSATSNQPSHTIGLLDIYGFESFEVNDLEQLCINLTNEKLQQHFNMHVFKWEQAEYEREGVDWSYIEFADNSDIVDVIEGKLGLFELLDEQCRFNKATGEDLAVKYASSSMLQSSGRYSRLRSPSTAFALEHYAGRVAYRTDNFLDKNKDFVVADHALLLGNSSQALVSELFTEAPTTSSDGRANGDAASRSPNGKFRSFQFSSVASRFKRQLTELMAQLHVMQPHYVRCIKPNAASRPAVFDNGYVLNQLKCGGVMEAVRISAAGFSYKRPFAAFVEYFWQVAPQALYTVKRAVAEQLPAEKVQAIAKQCAQQLLQAAGVREYHLGHTKVFLRGNQAALLEQRRLTVQAAAATRIQAIYRGVMAARHFRAVRKATVVLQSFYRGMMARRLAQRLREEKAALAVQTQWRRLIAQRRFEAVRAAAVAVQSTWRACIARRQYEALRRERAALCLQCQWRMLLCRRRYVRELEQHKAACVLQAHWRGHVQQRQYQELLPKHRAAQVIQRYWRTGGTGNGKLERLKQAVLACLYLHRAAVSVQAAWRCKAAREQYRKIKHKSKVNSFLHRFNQASDQSASDENVKRPAMRRQATDAHSPPDARMLRGSASDTFRKTKCVYDASEVVRADVVSLDNKDAIIRQRLETMGDFKVSSVLQFWKEQEAACLSLKPGLSSPISPRSSSGGRLSQPGSARRSENGGTTTNESSRATSQTLVTLLETAAQ